MKCKKYLYLFYFTLFSGLNGQFFHETALAIIATNKSNPGQADNHNKTALHRLKRKMKEVALVIIITGE